MCTVTYIPLQRSFLLASNRDENRNRPPALPPAIHLVHGQPLLFPRDGLAGGTWIGVNTNGYAIVLLNGALHKHQAYPPYRLSRGLVMLEMLSAPDPAGKFTGYDLQDIEPFTLVISGNGRLSTARWDGLSAHVENADLRQPQIWSSATLYPAEVRAKRAAWFRGWLEKNPVPDARSLALFHQFTGDGDPENDLRMQRPDGIFTNSISVLDCSPSGVKFDYLDLRTQASSRESLSFVTSPSESR